MELKSKIGREFKINLDILDGLCNARASMLKGKRDSLFESSFKGLDTLIDNIIVDSIYMLFKMANTNRYGVIKFPHPHSEDRPGFLQYGIIDTKYGQIYRYKIFDYEAYEIAEFIEWIITEILLKDGAEEGELVDEPVGKDDAVYSGDGQ